MNTIILAGITIIGLGASLIKSRKKTGKSLKQAVSLGRKMVPEILGILLLISLLLTVMNKDMIQKTLGSENVLFGTSLGAVIGSITIIPGIIAFPLSKELLIAGASKSALAAFITTLTMVGIATSPLEKRYFGLKFTLQRNILAFVFAIIIALLVTFGIDVISPFISSLITGA